MIQYIGIVIIIIAFVINYIILKKAIYIIKLKDKTRIEIYNRILSLWIENKNNNKNIKNYLKKNNFNNIAIYGCGELGKRLAEELIANGFLNISIIDNVKQEFIFNKHVIETESLNEFNDNVQMIIVTPVHQFNDIKKVLIDKNINCSIVSLEEIVKEIYFDMD